MKTHTVKILPEERSIRAADGADLLGALVAAGIYITAACGGQGTCGRCRVNVREGDVPMESGAALSDDELARGIRLACRSQVRGNLTVEVPETSRLRARAISDASERISAQPLFDSEEDEISRRLSLPGNAPVFRKIFIEPPTPSLNDSVSDLTRIAREIKNIAGIEISDTAHSVLSDMPRILRENDWKVTATLTDSGALRPASETNGNGFLLTSLRGGRADDMLALAVDVGTTTVKAQLVDAASGAALAEKAEYNRQIPFGEDVISRIIVANKGQGLKKLQAAAAETVNALLNDILAETGRSRDSIAAVFAAGNTTMTHLLLGVEPRHIRETPYVPAAAAFPPCRARAETGLDVPPGAFLFSFPAVASYVGGDIVSGALAAGIHSSPLLTLYMDIGTNGEIVVGNSEWLMTAACSAGPAFEGGGLRRGMRAAAGAIEGFYLDPDSLEPTVLTIGRGKPEGICGSGIITILAELLKYGILSQNGKLNPAASPSRIRPCDDGLEYILSRAEGDDRPEDITISEADLDNILRAKAAVYAGCKTLLNHAGLSFPQLDRVIITGAFGSYIDIEKAIVIGLLPELPRDRFFYIPNAALLGARLAACSAAVLREADNLARMMTHIELSDDPHFMHEYMAALFLPHTHAGEFPATARRLAELRSNK